MGVAGDVLEQPETGWKRYDISQYPINEDYPINEYPQIYVFQDTGIRIETPRNPEDKIKIGSRIRIFGKITNPITASIQAVSSMDTKIGTAPPTTIMRYPVMPLTDNKYTLIAEIELTDVYFPQDSTYIHFWGNTEYGDRQAVISAIDIFEEEKTDPIPESSLAEGLIGHWRFQNGDLSDLSGNGRDLVCIGTQVNAPDRDGIANNAVDLNNSSYYKTNNLTHPLFGVSEWSICMWVNFRTYYGNEGFLTIKPDGGGYNGTWFADSKNTIDVNGVSLLRPANGWHFVIWEKLSTDDCKFYIDGVAYNINTLSIISTNDLTFGKRTSYPDRYPNADFDEISMYNRVLTADERAELLARGVNYNPDTTPPSLNASYINEVTENSSKLNVTSNENSTAYYEIRESPTNNAKVGDVLTEPESGWTRYKVSDGVSLNNKIVLGDSGFMGGSYESPSDGCLYHVSTTDFSKIPLGSKIRVIGKDIKTLEPYTENVFVAEFIVDQETINAGYISVAAPGQEISVKALSAIDIVLPSPTPEELKVTHTGTIALIATVESQVEITGLTENTEYDVYIVAEDAVGNLQTTVTKLEFKTNKSEEEEDMKEILLGLLFLKLRVAGTTEWIELGDSKTEAKFKYEEKYADVKTVESGSVEKVIESTNTSIEVGISQVSKDLIDKLSNTIALKTEGTTPYLEGGAGIGTVAPKFEVIAHPIEEGTTTEYDVYFPKAVIETSIDKTGKAGDQLVFNLKIEALFDRTEKCKFRIGKNPA